MLAFDIKPPTEEATPDNVARRERLALLKKLGLAAGALAAIGGGAYLARRHLPKLRR